ncbi:TetR family transcriptional regulator [Pseudosporangium ferrugineum]|uniref:TetR family transcriptional regulator n=1 Tax=Pseudosporangium ferrugineum TaxID=439699 RepID=A0A2T0S1Z7_9ACTN|nr:TetR family transcriptional regulator [Pseudosporangium ferrugineum]PRY27451.1 TetR family transcriptional regulator [Pseudosporangium ferrugineum]
MTPSQDTLRARTRRAVQREIGDAALALFIERGFDATPIDAVAAAVGMSTRSVFRYFATKEDIVIGKLDLAADRMLETLAARPPGEPVWVSLRHLFDVDDPRPQGSTAAIHRVVLETPALLAAYLQKLQEIQEAVALGLRERAAAAGRPYPADDPTPRALTAAAFGCFVAAQHSWLASGASTPLADAVDRAMATLAPATEAQAPAQTQTQTQAQAQAPAPAPAPAPS